MFIISETDTDTPKRARARVRLRTRKILGQARKEQGREAKGMACSKLA